VGAIVGVVIGYVLGTRAGEQGWVELKEALKVISASEEVRDLVTGGFSITRELLGRGSGFLAGALGASEAGSKLRRAA
jgi:hypothetical protein